MMFRKISKALKQSVDADTIISSIVQQADGSIINAFVNSSNDNKSNQDDDISLIKFYSQCFDRPAFQDHFNQEGSMEAFDKAIENTITAINTGCLLSNDGDELARAKGKSFLLNPNWREQMDVIVDLLRAIRIGDRFTSSVN